MFYHPQADIAIQGDGRLCAQLENRQPALRFKDRVGSERL